MAAAAAANKETGEKKISGDADAGGDKVGGTEEKKDTVVGDIKIAAEVAAAPPPTEGVQKTDTDMADAADDKPDSAEGTSEAAAALEGESKHAREEVGDGDKSADEPSAKKQKVVV